MPTLYFITHPDVMIDFSIPIPQWKLSPTGILRMKQMLHQPWIPTIGAIYGSTERKAVDGAEILAQHLRLDYTTYENLGENDRSATGALPQKDFDVAVDFFFGHPEQSYRGWETAKDAQQRIVNAINRVIEQTLPNQNIAVIAHGGVGTLLLCHLKQLPISRKADQPDTNGGNYFSFDIETRKLHHGWQLIDKS